METTLKPSTRRAELASRLELALANNLQWYDSVCGAHGVPGAIEGTCWSNPHVVPRFYSNLITLDERSGEAQRAAIQALLEREIAPEWSVKDSFAALDLHDLDFHKLFDASWIWRAAKAAPPEDNGELVWSAVNGARELEAWEAAWSDHDANARSGAQPRLFLPELLNDRNIAFLAGRRGHPIAAVAIANRTGDVVGLSNVFAPGGATETCWAGCVRAVQSRFPGLPMVGYERGDDLSAAQGVGFESIGPLTVWLRSGD